MIYVNNAIFSQRHVLRSQNALVLATATYELARNLSRSYGIRHPYLEEPWEVVVHHSNNNGNEMTTFVNRLTLNLHYEVPRIIALVNQQQQEQHEQQHQQQRNETMTKNNTTTPTPITT